MGLLSKIFGSKKDVSNVDIDNKAKSSVKNVPRNENCIKLMEFASHMEKLLAEDRYIARSDYKKYIDEYQKIISFFEVLSDSGMLGNFCDVNGVEEKDIVQAIDYYNNAETYVEDHNEEFLARAMVEEKEYLDNVLKAVDPVVVLDEDQRKVVLTDEDYCLVIAGAGAGKTTILNILGGMDKATSGEVIVDGKEITKLNDKKLIEYRRNDIGFVFQFYNLVQNLTAKENVELATQICSDALDVNEILEKVGLSDRKDNFPAQLSGGEQQRVAIARAIAKNPKLLLCDEPTGALDYKTGKSILKLLQEMARKEKMTVAIITHNGAIAPMADKVIHFKNGTAEKIEINDNPISIDEIEW